MDCKQECAKKYICKNHPNICGICISVSCVTNKYPCFLEKDLVEVVRCKDCKFFISDICRHDFAMNFCRADDFCSYGERKDS